MTQTTDKNRNIQWIATLRGLAILLVFICHYVRIPYDNLLFISGRVGVIFFVMISGFLASVSLKSKTKREFLINRLIRIYPLYWIILTAYCLICLDSDYSCTVMEYLTNLTLFAEYFGGRVILIITWMLSIMLISYVVLVHVNNKSRNYHNVTLILLCAASVLAAGLRYATNMPMPVAIPLLTTYTLIGFITERCELSPWHVLVTMASVLLSVIIAYPEMWIAYMTAYTIGFCMFYLFRQRNINIYCLDILGRVGYAFYLSAVLPDILLKRLLPGMYSDITPAVYAIYQFSATILLACLITRFTDKPLTGFLRKRYIT